MVLDTEQFIDWLTGVGMDADEARSFVDALNEDRAELLTGAEFTAAMSGLSGEMAQHRGETREQLAAMRELIAGLRAEFAELRAESREQHAETRSMMREQIGELRVESHERDAETRVEARERDGETRAMMRAQHAAVLAQMATMRADLIEANARTAERTADRADEQIGAMRNQTMSLVRIAMGLGLANFAALVAVLIRFAF